VVWAKNRKSSHGGSVLLNELQGSSDWRSGGLIAAG
jgi:hypothetical protein